MICSTCNKTFKANELYDMFGDGMVYMCKDCAKQWLKTDSSYKRYYPKMYNIIMEGEN